MHRAAESLKRNEIPAAANAQEEVLAALRDFAEHLHQTHIVAVLTMIFIIPFMILVLDCM